RVATVDDHLLGEARPARGAACGHVGRRGRGGLRAGLECLGHLRLPISRRCRSLTTILAHNYTVVTYGNVGFRASAGIFPSLRARLLAGVVAVEVPVARDRAHPHPRLLVGSVHAGREEEPRDRPLAALVVAVEEVDGDPGPVRDRGFQRPKQRVVGLANRGLPEAHVAGGTVRVAAVAPKSSTGGGATSPVMRSACTC